MQPKDPTTASTQYWMIAAGLFVWGVAYAGLVGFSFLSAGETDWESLVAKGVIRPEYAEYILAIPNWVRVLSAAVAVTRLGAGVCLLIRRSWAVPLYGISLILMLVLMFRGFVLEDAASVIRPTQIGVEVGFILLGFFAVWFSRKHRATGLLR